MPGGKRDEGDRDDTHTALREAEEEIGLTDVEVLGSLRPVLSKHHLSVYPPGPKSAFLTITVQRTMGDPSSLQYIVCLISFGWSETNIMTVQCIVICHKRIRGPPAQCLFLVLQQARYLALHNFAENSMG